PVGDRVDSLRESPAAMASIWSPSCAKAVVIGSCSYDSVSSKPRKEKEVACPVKVNLIGHGLGDQSCAAPLESLFVQPDAPHSPVEHRPQCVVLDDSREVYQVAV